MKKIKIFAIAAMALMVGFTSCNKNNEIETADTGEINVTLSFKNAAATRADGAAATAGVAVAINDGFLCFATADNTITKVYTISGAITADNNIQNTDLGTTAVTLTGILRTSTQVFMIANKGTLTAIPAVGGSMTTFLSTNDVLVQDQGDYTKVISTGSSNLIDAGADKKTAAITLGTKVSRIQIIDINFDSEITAGTIEGIYINNYAPTMKLAGTLGTILGSTSAAEFVNSGSVSTLFPLGVEGFVFDAFSNKTITGTVAPTNGVWGYNLFASATPQIVIKLAGVVVSGTTLGTKFVTINGFSDNGTNVPALVGGMIYTIGTGSLVIKPGDLGVTPGLQPISVDVTVTTVKWEETSVTPNL